MGVALVLATRNPAKAAQMRELLAGLDLELSDGASFPEAPDPGEEGGSHLAIAIGKAVAWSRALGTLVVTSDGGLSIPALGDGWSSLITRRGTGADVPDEERARRLLRRMRDLEGERRACWWTEAVAVARSGGTGGGVGSERAGRLHRARLRPARGWRQRFLGGRAVGDARRRAALGVDVGGHGADGRSVGVASRAVTRVAHIDEQDGVGVVRQAHHERVPVPTLPKTLTPSPSPTIGRGEERALRGRFYRVHPHPGRRAEAHRPLSSR